MNKYDTIVWLILIVLTIIAFTFSESFNYGYNLVYLLLAITAIKYFSVGFQFMELHRAHRFWKLSFSFLFLLFMSLVLFFS